MATLINAIVQKKKLKIKKKELNKKKMPYIYNRKWRDIDEKNAPKKCKTSNKV